MKKIVSILCTIIIVIFLSTDLFAKMGSGKVSAKSDDVDIQMFGAMQVYPTFINNPDFNDDQTNWDYVMFEAGFCGDDDVSVRSETRLGFEGYGQNWTFHTILETQFVWDKRNTDRGSGNYGSSGDSAFAGDAFGIERCDFTYDFTSHGLPVTLYAGWGVDWLDVESGGLLYAYDDPHIGLSGEVNNIKWKANYRFYYDTIDEDDGGEVDTLDGDSLDWDVVDFRLTIPVETGLGTMNLNPIYAYSDNKEANADVSYFALQTFGQMGSFTPRAEFIYAYGEKDRYRTDCNLMEDDDADIESFAGYASLMYNHSPAFNPYIGFYYARGDDDAYDDDIEAYNPLNSAMFFTQTLGFREAFIYQGVPALGTQLFSNLPTMFGANEYYGGSAYSNINRGGGYGGFVNCGSAENAGVQAIALGVEGKYGKWDYKLQGQYMEFEETGALEDLHEREGIFSGEDADDIDDELGTEIDFRLIYHFNEHFFIGNFFSLFDPGDGIEDLHGEDYDEMAIANSILIDWHF